MRFRFDLINSICLDCFLSTVAFEMKDISFYIFLKFESKKICVVRLIQLISTELCFCVVCSQARGTSICTTESGVDETHVWR